MRVCTLLSGLRLAIAFAYRRGEGVPDQPFVLDRAQETDDFASRDYGGFAGDR